MKNLYATGKIIVILVGAVLGLAAEDTVFAQSGSRPSPIDRRVEQINRQGEQYERENLARELKGKPEKEIDRKRTQAKADQVREDFETLQAGYNQLVLAMAAKNSPDHNSILDMVAEVNKRAIRLKDNLALPRPKIDKDREAKNEPIPEQTQEPLLALRKHIYSFLTNPLFESAAVLNLEQAEKANRDLDRIIELSESIKKNGDKARKPAKS